MKTADAFFVFTAHCRSATKYTYETDLHQERSPLKEEILRLFKHSGEVWQDNTITGVPVLY